MIDSLTIVGLGEALFDVFADRSLLGGAPLNVAVHAHQLATQWGGRGVVMSRVGNDALGKQLLAELVRREMGAEHVQVDPRRATGQVLVTLERGEPSYEILRDVAWDHLELTPADRELARTCSAVCFGSLGQRDSLAREAIQGFVAAARRAVRMFDVNLRQDFFDENILEKSCQLASVVKLNENELPVIADLLGFDAHDEACAATLLEVFELDAVVLTRGARGTILFTKAGWFEGKPVSFPLEPGADSVGAGDACAAGLLLGLVSGWSPERCVDLANRAGAFVASRAGGTPELPSSFIH